MLIHKYDRDSGAWTKTVDAAINPKRATDPDVRRKFIVSANATTVTPPAPQAGKARVFDGNAWAGVWTFVDDYRGQAGYEKEGGAQVEIKTPGELPPEITLLKPGPQQKWDEASGAWVEDPATKEAEEARATMIAKVAAVEADPDVAQMAANLRAMSPADWRVYVDSNLVPVNAPEPLRDMIFKIGLMLQLLDTKTGGAP